MSDVVVRAEGLRKAYGAVPVLEGVDLALRRGEVLALLGPNGAGKTTTVKILTTLLRPDGGRASVAGFDVVRDAAQVRRVISLTGQQVALDLKQTGRENLTMVARLSRVPRRQVRQRVADLLDGVGLTDVAERRVATYSGGMRRRLDLAAGLVARPQVLFLDEPTTGLDPRSRRALWDLVRDVVAGGTSLLLTTQYLDEADELADRVALIDAGRVAAEGTADELKRRVGQARVELDLAAADDVVRVRSAFADLLGEAAADGPPTEGLARGVALPTDGSLAHVRELIARVEATGVVPAGWRLREPTLDDVFLTLTGHLHHAAGIATTSAETQEKAA
ncbi:ATP-binding cassette domain-containing protein [Xylanimonas ulmi]|uniref:ABC-2 type transport system ATP-binding protein n=1 Tax=Xylanimonas ulmi TaxID=228973 RepID=A0A4Q7M6M1_9MICO|nr:ATP-binding cassette domain-containing protein [Xylanibacterium ulmi]RZS62717.1 ABC-2 type transport system ATP-binding protein [Xylanibacterium ulmi]